MSASPSSSPPQSPAPGASAPSRLNTVIARNAAFITVGQLALKIVNFLYTLYVVRRLGGSQFGQYSTVLGWVGLFFIFAELGVSQYASREVARDHSQSSGMFWNLIGIRLALAVVGIIGITAGAMAVGYSHALVLGVFFFTWTFVLSAIEAPLEAVLNAHERMDLVTILSVFQQIVYNLMAGFVLLRGYGFIELIAVGNIAMLPQIALAIYYVRKHKLIHRPVVFDYKRWPAMIRFGIPFAMITLALTITFSADTVMLSKFRDSAEVGWYNVAYNFSRSLLFFFSGLSTAIVPTLSREFVRDSSTVERWFHRFVKFIALTSIPLAAGGMVVSSQLIPFLYSAQYAPAALAFAIIVWDVPCLMFTSLAGNITTIVNEEKSAARIYGTIAVLNVILNLILIPRFGMIAASSTTVITDLVGVVLFHQLLGKKLKLPDMRPVLARVVVVAVLVALVAWLLMLAAWPLILVLITCAGVYVFLVVALRLLNDDERRIVARLFQRLIPQPQPQP